MTDKSQKKCRLPEGYRQWLKKRLSPLGKPYVFGSRVDMNAKGGDIDILLLSSEKLSFKERMEIRKDFILQFGDQKLDFVNYTFDEEKPFKNLIMLEAIPL